MDALRRRRVCSLWSDSLEHMRSFAKDLIDLRVLPIKLLFFMELAGIVTIWPHISTHMAHLRLTPDETGLIVMLGGLAGIVASLSAGYIGDKMGNFKAYLGLALLLEGVTGVVLAFLPPAIVDVAPPGVAAMEHVCVDDFLHVRWQHDRCVQHPGLPELNLTLRRCVVACQSVNDSSFELGGLACGIGDDRCSVLFPERGLPPADALDVRIVNSTNTSSQLRVLSVGVGGVTGLLPVTCPRVGLGLCRLRCADTVARADVCAPDQDRSSHALTLSLYIGLRVVYAFCLGTTYTLIDTAVLSFCAQYGIDYGFQRLWGTLAALVVSPLAGRVMDWLSYGGETNFRPGFYMLGVFRLLSLIVLFFVNISFRNKPSESLLKYTWRLIQKIELSVLFFVLLLTGMVVGHIETFTYVFLASLGADRTLIGTTITVGSSVELLMLAISGFCLRLFGHVSLIVFGILLYGVRLVGYAVIVDPRYSLLLETLDGIDGGLMNTAAVTYAASMVSPELVATVRGILGCFLFGGGRALGAQLGGYLVLRVGHRQSFLVFAGVAALAAVAYLVFHALLRRRRSRSFQLAGGRRRSPIVGGGDSATQPAIGPSSAASNGA
ncbi:uncharacterized protein LOC119096417 isoform X2 [Pollicipes pollicipes]|uniref:uncharacterized protein LOC119096417 isoform X2 n=1 Tax=Pollicipes pollicipes TaxID=41117 RepID=UPI0018849B86|nr:uncharacterized protein LOC119096417 isoform X2 [Pollicipes pollicipes]